MKECSWYPASKTNILDTEVLSQDDWLSKSGELVLSFECLEDDTPGDCCTMSMLYKEVVDNELSEGKKNQSAHKIYFRNSLKNLEEPWNQPRHP